MPPERKGPDTPPSARAALVMEMLTGYRKKVTVTLPGGIVEMLDYIADREACSSRGEAIAWLAQEDYRRRRNAWARFGGPHAERVVHRSWRQQRVLELAQRGLSPRSSATGDQGNRP
jgi:hypothetical protein